ncbi:MAG: hypothetical protein LBG72_04775 [Spirochaetaceae bacterium]|jgi:hypothetical protein|nr:hypothetical protein [Spirochaetaceae bacterium]
MRKNIAANTVSLLTAYIFIFFVLTLTQWARTGAFTRKMGNVTINAKLAHGQNGISSSVRETEYGEEYDLSGGAKITFMGLEFQLGTGADAVLCEDINGDVFSLYPKILNLSAQYARFRFDKLHFAGTSETDASSSFVELNFYPQAENDGEELVISSVLPDGIESITVPFKLLRRTSILRGGNGQSYISVDGKEWHFDRPAADFNNETLVLTAKQPALAFQQRGGGQFKILDYIVAGAMEKTRYNEVIGAWRDKAWTTWAAQTAAGTTNESIISAYIAESARRGNYREALGRLPAEFINARPGYLSSPFMGRLPAALQSKSEYEKNNVERLTALLKSGIAAFLQEDKIFVYLAQRSYTSLFDEAINQIRMMQPDALTMELLPAIFEGWWAWSIWHENEENPFELLAQQARHLIAENLKKDRETGAVFAAQDANIDVLFNARLGAALTVYGESSSSSEWAALGRSIALSCMDYSNDSGNFPSKLREEQGIINPVNGEGVLDPLSVYLVLAVSDYYPHAVGVSTLVNGVWVWTMSPSIAASYADGILDFAVTFFQGSTHYLMISGVRPFSKIQMRDIDYRSDPQFENWNAPGWVYSPAEQTILVKLLHNNPVEHIKIFF